MRADPADNDRRRDDPVIVYDTQLTDFSQLTEHHATI